MNNQKSTERSAKTRFFRRPKVEEGLTAEYVREVLNYNSETGAFTWRVGSSSRTPAGSVAGSLKDCGYIIICIKNTMYRAHRLAWLYTYGEWPAEQVDHINGVRCDNRIQNLRKASSAQNLQNLRKPHADNITGLLGVSRNRNGFRARIKVDGKVIHLGTFKTPEIAHSAYLSAKRKYHSHCTV